MKPRRDYHQKNFRNPFFPKKQSAQPGGKKRRPVIFWAVLLIILSALLIWLNGGRNFQISTVELKGSTIASQTEIEAVINQQLEKKRYLIFSQSSIFFFSPKQTENLLAQNFGQGHLEVRKKYFKTVVVSATPDISLIAWSAQQKTYYLDINGIALRQAGDMKTTIESGQQGTDVIRAQPQFAGYPLVFDESNAEIIIGQEATSPEIVRFIINLTKMLQAKSDFEIAHYTIMSPYADQITMKTLTGWQVHFRTTDSVEQQINRLLTVLQQKVNDRNKLEYIDLRYGDKVFYK